MIYERENQIHGKKNFFTESPGLSRPMSAMGGGGGIYNNPTSLIDSPDGGPVSGTENPLWIDQKYKAYEEQELTMTVFSDQVSLIIYMNIFRAIFDLSNKMALLILRRMYALYVKKQFGEDKN